MELREYYEEAWEKTEETAEQTGEEEALEESSFRELLEDPELFDRFAAGDYTYVQNEFGKHAYGCLLEEAGERDLYAQKTLPDKPQGYDSSHLIANRFRGVGGYENLEAAPVSLNRGAYRCLENTWAEELEEEKRVYVDVQAYHTKGSPIPSAWMGYSISEDLQGNRDWEAFSFTNVSKEEQASWERILEEEL